MSNNSKKVTKIVVDRKACIGAATCIVVSPDAFSLDSENIAVVSSNALKRSFDELLMAAQACPVSAITLFDEDGVQVYPHKT